LTFGLALLAQPGPIAAGDPSLDAKLESIAAAEALVDEKVAERNADLHETMALASRLLRQRGVQWMGREELRAHPWARGWLRRILAIKRRELSALEAELDALRENREELIRDDRRAEHQPTALVRPVPGALVHGYGTYRHRASGARLFRSGIVLRARAGESVSAPMTGVLRYVGVIRGLGNGAIIATEDGWLVVLGGLETDARRVGERVGAGSALGTATSAELYLEVRVGERGTRTIDPKPLLRP